MHVAGRKGGACTPACLAPPPLLGNDRLACRITPWTAPPPSPPGTAPLLPARAPGPDTGRVQCQSADCRGTEACVGMRRRPAASPQHDAQRSGPGQAPFRQSTARAAGRPRPGQAARANDARRQQRVAATSSKPLLAPPLLPVPPPERLEMDGQADLAAPIHFCRLSVQLGDLDLRRRGRVRGRDVKLQVRRSKGGNAGEAWSVVSQGMPLGGACDRPSRRAGTRVPLNAPRTCRRCCRPLHPRT